MKKLILCVITCLFLCMNALAGDGDPVLDNKAAVTVAADNVNWTTVLTTDELETALDKAGSWANPDPWIVVAADISLDEAITVGSLCTLRFVPGSVITLGAYNITFNGVIDTPPLQIFSENSSGKVLAGTNGATTSVIYAEWWGAAGDGSTNDAAAINSALGYASEIVVQLLARDYYVGAQISLNNLNTLQGMPGIENTTSITGVNTLDYIVSLAGNGVLRALTIKHATPTTATTGVVKVDSAGTYSRLEDLNLNGGDTILHIQNSYSLIVNNVAAWNAATYNVHIIDSQVTSFTNCSFGRNGHNVRSPAPTAMVAIETGAGTPIDSVNFDRCQFNTGGGTTGHKAGLRFIGITSTQNGIFRLTNCHFETIVDFITTSASTTHIVGLQLIGNTISAINSGEFLNPDSGNVSLKYAQIVGNRFIGSFYLYAPTYLTMSDNICQGESFEFNAVNGIISNNIFIDTTTPYGVTLSGAAEGIFSNNRFGDGSVAHTLTNNWTGSYRVANNADIINGPLDGRVSSFYSFTAKSTLFGLIFRAATDPGNAYANFFMKDDTTDYLNIVVGSNAGTTGLKIDANSDVTIGGDLHVNGAITATGACCADFVFAPEYDLPPIGSLESSIVKLGHLPGMTQGVGTEQKPIDLGKALSELIIKTEEQALYIIQLNKRMAELEN